ncbi:unnamed protein product [Somion occarium]|uniref:NAD-dependent epimerase/dehydratase domain-containing protein n=1 Tax=Somion occarium TaxID=3059160 RepID=A0ABP1DN87_9APHY
MPTATSGKILVTGANGFVAVWVIKDLLENGYSVRGTVRSEARGAHVQHLFASYGDKFELVIVEDITKEGAFDEAVKGIDAIEHVASPVSLAANDPNELIKPAVEGTRSILRSALRYGSQVKRVAITSSFAAVGEVGVVPDGGIHTDAHWNNKSVREVETKGAAADQVEKYCASKTLAERAAWAFYEEKKTELPFDIVTLIPPYVFGPWLHEAKDMSPIGIANLMFYDLVVNGKADKDTLVNDGVFWADVRDVARAHILALQVEQAGGKRLIINAGPFKWQDFVNAARRVSSKIPPGNESYNAATAKHPAMLDTSKTQVILPQLTYHTFDECAAATLDCLENAGWWTRRV